MLMTLALIKRKVTILLANLLQVETANLAKLYPPQQNFPDRTLKCSVNLHTGIKIRLVNNTSRRRAVSVRTRTLQSGEWTSKLDDSVMAGCCISGEVKDCIVYC